MIAVYNLGYMYKNGREVDKDSKKAFEFFKQSADRGGTNTALRNLL